VGKADLLAHMATPLFVSTGHEGSHNSGIKQGNHEMSKSGILWSMSVDTVLYCVYEM
jgi:hypothetical protein